MHKKCTAIFRMWFSGPHPEKVFLKANSLKKSNNSCVCEWIIKFNTPSDSVFNYFWLKIRSGITAR